jgi:thioredoxin-related protein
MQRMALVFLSLVIVLTTASSVPAQEVRWRTDYAAARKEAATTGKPMLLDFGTEACMWCRKLDATTFRDRAIVDVLNARFIPVKVDGERDSRLTQSVGVQAFPTIVLISAEGKIFARHEGYADNSKMMALLRQAPAAKEEAKPTASAQFDAAVLLAAARADHDAGRFLMCIQKCDKLTTAANPEAAEARRISASITGDPEKWKRVTAQLEADLTAVKHNLETALKRPVP